MQKFILKISIAFLTITMTISTVTAQIANQDEALTVAGNWIASIIEKKGTWGGAEYAEVEQIQEFKRGKQVLGYLCQVNPKGFIVISLRKELAPVKTYSATSDLDPESDIGLADVIKDSMARSLNAIAEMEASVRKAQTGDLQQIIEIDYRPAWDELQSVLIDRKTVTESVESTTNYHEGDILLSSIWDQDPPYNNYCPHKSCDNENGRTKVGCVSTAAAQIMRYWGWPRAGTGGNPYEDRYDWINMPDILTMTSPAHQINAVAELCYEIGKSVNTDYECDESTAWLGSKPGIDMTEAFPEHFRFSDEIDFAFRSGHTANGWFDFIKNNINSNQPLQYGIQTRWLIGGHSMVLDGWQQVGSTKQYHMNYGWDNNRTAWYTLDALYASVTHTTENMIRKIRPAPSLKSWISGDPPGSGWYSPPTYPYRYFNVNATGHNATFDAGHYLQFLPGVSVKCTSPDGGRIQFRGWSTSNTTLYARDDRAPGIRIYSGLINLYQNGSVKFY